MYKGVYPNVIGYASHSKTYTEITIGITTETTTKILKIAGLIKKGGENILNQEIIIRARQTNLVTYLSKKGYKLKREPGSDENYRVLGHQGLIIRNNHFIRFGGNEKGNAIDFVVQIEHKPFRQAVQELLSCQEFGVTKSVLQDKQHKKFELPTPSEDNNRILAYLTSRGIPRQLVLKLIQKGLVYQDVIGNCVFPCTDYAGQIRGAFLRGTTNKRWLGVAKGSNVSYPWVLKLNNSNTVTIVESPIDSLSFFTLYPQTHGYIAAMGGLRDKCVTKFLDEHPEVTVVVLATDNDQSGYDFAKDQFEKLANYEVSIFHPPQGDWNDFLLSVTHKPG